MLPRNRAAICSLVSATSGRPSPAPTPFSPSTARASRPMPKRRMFSSPGFTRPTISPLKNSQPGYAIMSSPPPHNPLLNMQLGYALLRDRRVPIRTKLIALGIGAAAIGAIELLQLPVEGVIAALLPFIGAAGDLVLDSAEAVIGPVLIATILLPHIAPADIVRQIRAERARVS